MFNSSEPRYLLNELYITDYCIWIQKISEKKIKKLGDLFDKVCNPTHSILKACYLAICTLIGGL